MGGRDGFSSNARVLAAHAAAWGEGRVATLFASTLPLILDPRDHDSLLAAEGHQQSACSDGSNSMLSARRSKTCFMY